MANRYWLLKTEPEVFSIDDLAAAPNQATCWEGVRNYQARNMLRDDFRLLDRVLIYHSVTNPSVVGTAVVVRQAYPDYYAWDTSSPYYDEKSDPANPRWFMVDIRFEQKFANPLPLSELRTIPALKDMELLRKGSRLSVQPVRPAEWRTILKLANNL